MSSVIEEYYNLKRQIELTPEEMKLFESRGYGMGEKDEKFKQIAEWVTKYYKLKLGETLKFAPANIPETSLKAYMCDLKSYILNGKPPKRCGNLTKYIDRAITEIEPIEPQISKKKKYYETKDVRFKALIDENNALKEKIKKLEKQPLNDFSEIKLRLKDEINRLTNLLIGIENVEREFLHQTE